MLHKVFFYSYIDLGYPSASLLFSLRERSRTQKEFHKNLGISHNLPLFSAYFPHFFSSFKICSDITFLVSNLVICTFSLINLVRSFYQFYWSSQRSNFHFYLFCTFLFPFISVFHTVSFLLFSLWLTLLDFDNF